MPRWGFTRFSAGGLQRRQTMTVTNSIIDEPDWLSMEDEETFLTTDIYHGIRQRLALRGVPPEQVAFIHDAKDSRARSRLFEAVNQGKTRVLIGSTEKMGTGMNAQERLTAIHQVTPPWRPADIEQQVGRMWRQGNLYPQVLQFVYVTEGSFDGYMWQSLETKLTFIEQVDADFSVREIDDISDGVLTFSEIKALASGNPKIIQKVTLDAELMRLNAVQASWKTGRRKAEMMRGRLDYAKDSLRKAITELEETIAVRDANTLERFTILLKKSAYADDEMMVAFTNREAAGKHLRSLVSGAAVKLWSEHLATLDLGIYKGIKIESLLDQCSLHQYDIEAKALAFFRAGGKKYQIMVSESDKGITMSLDARFRALDKIIVDEREKLENTIQKQVALDEELVRPWEHQGRYFALIEELNDLEAELDTSDGESSIDLEVSIQDLSSAIAESKAILQDALDVLRAMHRDSEVLARFDVEAVLTDLDDAEPDNAAIPLADVETLTSEIMAKQAELAQLEFALSLASALPDNEIVQLDMFGGFATPKKTRRRRRRKVAVPQSQITFFPQ